MTFAEGLEKIYAYAFSKSGVTEVVLPKTLEYIGSRTFFDCPSLTAAEFKGPVASLNEAKNKLNQANYLNRINSSHYLEFESVFANCPALKTAKFAEGQETIGDEFFYNCSALKSVNVPASVTSIGQYAFYGCSSLPTVAIGGTLSELGNSAFRNCSSLHYVSFGGNAAPLETGTDVFTGTKARMVSYANPNGTGWTGGVTDVGFPEDGTWQGRSIVDIAAKSPLAGNDYDFYPQVGTFVAKKTSNNYEWPAPVILTTNKYVQGAVTPVREVATVVQGDPVYLHYAFNEYWRGENFAAMTNTFTLAGAAEGEESVEVGVETRDYGYSGGTNCVLAILQDLEPGEYTLTMNLNAARNLAETDYANNTTSIAFTVVSGAEPVVVYKTVTFDANGGVCATATKKVVSGKAVGELPKATRDDYTFLGWFTAAGEQVSETTIVTADVTYLAQWKANEPEPPQPPEKETVTIAKPTAVTDLVYSGEALTGVSGAAENLTATGDLVATNAGDYAASFALPAETDTQTFAWDDGSTNAYRVEWTIAPRDLDDESVAFDEIPEQIATGKEIKPTVTMAFGEALCELGTDYTVAYSNNVEVGTGLAVVTGVSNFTGTATLEFSIVAPEPDLYTVTFDANGGTVSENARQVADGDPIGELPVAERAGYDFLGWFTDEDEQVEETDIVTKDVTLQAGWEKIAEEATYTVIVGAKVSIDVGVKGCKAFGLPKGLTYDAKKGLVTGSCKKTASGETEAVFTKGDDVELYALFNVREENEPTIVCEGLSSGSFTVGVAGDAAGIPLEIEAESGVKSVTAKNLPAGMKLAQDKKTKEWVITGSPTKAGTYDKIEISLTTVAGTKVTQKFEVEVAALPATAVGSANGFVLGAFAEDPYEGTFQFTSTEAGKLSAKVVTVAGTYSFAATAWTAVTGDVYYAMMTTKKGETLALALDTAKGWNETQLTGSFAVLAGRGEGAASTYAIEAQRNAFGKLWYFNATGSETEGWKLTFAESAKSCAITVTLNADGKTAVAGKLGTLKVSASGYADVRGIAEGAIIADFATVVSAKSGSKTVKKMLTVKTNLWFDKSNDHAEGVGSAAFAQ